MTEERAPYRQYDDKDSASIERHAVKLINKTLREALPPDAEIKQDTGKGNLGNVVEKAYFGLTVGSSRAPDFTDAGIELKVTPLKRLKNGTLRSKERLVLQMIDFDEVRDEEWSTSSFLKKNKRLLLVFYEWEREVESALDYRFRLVRIWEIPSKDLQIIRRDWQIVVDKIKARDEESISGGDTNYLEACTKAATSAVRRTLNDGRQVKPRAWAFKGGYMNTVIDPSLTKKLKPVIDAKQMAAELTLEQAIASRFSPFIGLRADAIVSKLGVSVNPTAKHTYSLLTKAVVKGILGVLGNQRVAEFEKAEIVMRTIRLKPNGMPKEAVSFPAFDYFDLVEQQWEESDLRTVLDRRFFFVIYQLDDAGIPTLKSAKFWSMPRRDLDTDARQCFEETKTRIEAGQTDALPTSKENRVCHVRPHARNKKDVLPTPSGRLEVKKSFWLNQNYLKKAIAELI